ncbi:MAG TPA: hypothetical protein VHE30_13980 [Polyangiaceae bacterium]|nr:hypothetical protein [Polyangiaceae bacterium]
MSFARFKVPLVAALSLAFVQCGGGNGSRTPPPAIGAPTVPFLKKTRDERRAFMASRVVPKMREVFHGLDPKGDEKFGCETCHGEDAEVVDYRMPNSLYPLPQKNTIAEATDYDDKTTKFMVEHVVPAFAALLSQPVGDPEHPEKGVTCFTCHPHD